MFEGRALRGKHLAAGFSRLRGELVALFDSDLSGGQARFFEGFGEELVGVFVFVPGVDVVVEAAGRVAGVASMRASIRSRTRPSSKTKADDEGSAGAGRVRARKRSDWPQRRPAK